MANAERIVKYTLTLGIDPQSEALAKRLGAVMEEAQMSATEIAEREAEKRRRSSEKSLKDLEEKYAKTIDQVKQRNREVNDGLLKMGEGIATLGRGFVELGIASEKDLEKVVRVLARIQGTVDIVKGGIDAYRGLMEAVEAYRKSVEAAAAAEATLEAIRNRSAISSALSGGGAAAAGVAGGAAGGASSLSIAIGGLSAAIFGLPGAIAAALGSVALAGGVAAQSFNIGGTADALSDAGWYDPNSLFGWLTAQRDAMSITGYFAGNNYDTINAQDDALRSQDTTQRRYREYEQQTQERVRREQRIRTELSARQQQESLGFSREATLDQFRGILTPDQSMNRAQTAFMEAKRQRDIMDRMYAGTAAGVRQEFTTGEVEDQEQRTLRSLQEAIRLRKEALDVARATRQEEERAAEEAIRGLERQISKQKQLKKETEDKLVSAQERFGQLSAGEQQRLIAIKQKADRQGAASLTREERAALRGVGTEGALDFARQGDLEAARQAGFDQVFGGNERAKIQAAAQEKARLEIEVKAKREFIVKLDSDQEQMVNGVVSQVQVLLEQQREITDQQIERRLNEVMANQNGPKRNYLPPTT